MIYYACRDGAAPSLPYKTNRASLLVGEARFVSIKKSPDGVGWRTPERNPPDNFFIFAHSARVRAEHGLVLARGTYRSDIKTNAPAIYGHVVVVAMYRYSAFQCETEVPRAIYRSRFGEHSRNTHVERT